MKAAYKKAYLFAAILSMILYLLGIYTGILLQKNVEASIERRLKEIEKNIENTQLEYLYISNFGEKIPCNSLKMMVDETNKRLWDIGKELEKLESNESKFMETKKQYMLLSVRAWMLNVYLKERCKDDSLILLYFYSIPCDDCIKQGKILDDVRDNIFKERMKVFVLDAGLGLPIIDTIKKSYNVTTTPFIVFENKTFSGLTSKEEIIGALSD
ncbi:MAG: hypothetical protein QXO84_01625 [Candidatus Aenigmatarchaeota archaeon]